MYLWARYNEPSGTSIRQEARREARRPGRCVTPVSPVPPAARRQGPAAPRGVQESIGVIAMRSALLVMPIQSSLGPAPEYPAHGVAGRVPAENVQGSLEVNDAGVRPEPAGGLHHVGFTG